MKILFGGLTKSHDFLIKAVFEYLGYEAYPLPTPDNEALKIGKEYCNKGQCNPTYYTVGNLIKFLKEETENRNINPNEYMFLTIGACGPCRFGMYEMEYRKALKEAGFPEFKIFAFDQGKAFLEDENLMDLQFDKQFFQNLIKAIVLGDLINDIYYKVKPYEEIAGSTDEWRENSLNKLYETLKNGKSVLKTLKSIKKELDKIEVNYFQPKPKVKIMGEFFAQTTEGDGNYRLAQWLIEEGAEPIVEPVTTWIEYLIYKKIVDIKERAFKNRKEALKQIQLVRFLGIYLRGMYNLYRFLLGNKPDPLKSQKKMGEYANDYYNVKLAGGEGHMEVGKHIYVIKHKIAHMVISVKPFGCMPSTQSDGVQAKVTEDLGDSIFVSIETSGDAEVNMKSRVLMKLYDAKLKAYEEYDKAKRSKPFRRQNRKSYVNKIQTKNRLS